MKLLNVCIILLLMFDGDTLPKIEASVTLIRSLPQNFARFLQGFPDPSPNESESSVKLVFFYGPVIQNNQRYSLEEGIDIINHERFDKLKKSVLYIHGYNESLIDESNIVVVNSYIKRGDHNILYLDYSKLVDGNYFTDAVPNAIQLRHSVTDMIINLFKEGLDFSTFHLVGHSLGGQLAGMIGNEFQMKTKKKLKRISALDPAFPLFYPTSMFGHISASDADFVDVIHTDAGIYGAPISTGKVDFWPNGGNYMQPGCEERSFLLFTNNDLCSHRRSWRYWAESVENKYVKKFPSVKCISWYKYIMGLCHTREHRTFMGIDCDHRASGDYLLRTNSNYPFSIDE